MPLSAAWFTVGALSLAGIPPLAGFFAKDQIVGFAATSGREVAWVLASLGAFLSALYIARPLFLTFFGRRRRQEQAHEAPGPMQAPLAVLAFLTVVGGLFLGLTAEGGRLARFLEPVVGVVEHGEAALPEAALISISIVLALAAVAVAFWIWASGRVDWEAFPQRQPELAGG
jgi:NADH-quinone oxidoreductase subunit L